VNLGFNKGTIGKLQSFRNLITGFQKKLNEMEAFDLAYTIVQETGIIADLKSDQTPESVSRYENVEELLNGIKDFTDHAEGGGEMTLGDWLQEVTLMTDADLEKPEDKNKVSIMTIHSAKGLEFKHLVIAGVEEELFPSQMSIDNPKDLEEERRLFYVALTRAEKSALISYAALRYKWGIQNSCSPSRFIKEIEPKYLELPPDFYPLIAGKGSEEREPFVPDAYRKVMERRAQPGRIQSGGRRLVNVHSVPSNGKGTAQSQVPADFTPSAPDQITLGKKVEHPRFGIGKVLVLEGSGPNVKATVEFPIGRKQLLLKFAKLRVVE
jgi:DNA helicase-2/ATP-dependent DNA helicase PcrA